MPHTATDHPTTDQLSDVLANSGNASPVDVAVRTHVSTCDSCRETLAFLRSLNTQLESLPAPAASASLRERILSTSLTRPAPPHAGHVIEAHPPIRTARRWVPLAAMLAAGLAVTVMPTWRDVPELVAGTTAGTMTLSTAQPRNGERVSVRYTPGASLGRFRTLRLRARVRTADAEEYTALTPVVTLALLQRSPDGTYRGAFTLPDTIVYAALGVEDTSAAEIDDHDGRTWEVIRSAATGRPTLEALQQRAGDHMGRSWEVIFETAAQMVAAYPDSITAWSYLRVTHSWMGLSQDSVTALHGERVRQFDRRLRTSSAPSSEDMGRMYWYAHGVDTSVAAHWDARLRREAPTNSFVVQNRMIDVLTSLSSKPDTAAALRRFEQLWQDAPPDRHNQILQYATRLAVSSGDTLALRRWTNRLLTAALESTHRFPRDYVTRSVALDFARLPALRHEGLQRLRTELARVSASSPSTRSLDETQMEYAARQQRSIRNTMAALGEALALDGQHRAALDTLQRAAHDAWDLTVMRTLRKEALTAGDTGIALQASARLSVDPRTSAERRAEYQTFGSAKLGAARWQAVLDTARRDFVQHSFARMRPRSITTAVPVLTLDGKPADLRTALKGQVTVVAFLSRFCGPAVDVIPELRQLASDVRQYGVQTLVVYEERAPSAALSEFLRKQKVALPVMLDDTQSASAMFSQWGTPYFYVVDARGRIMSEPTSDTDELRVSIEAVRLAADMQ